ncbi:MAG: hypothetical protein ACE5IZ_01665 [Dehalococcoidia bacterium]
MAQDQITTIEFVLSEITATIDKQMSWVDSIDRKAIALLTLGSALITILPAIATRLSDGDASWRLISLVLPGAIYILAMWFLWGAFKPRAWGLVPDPPLLQAHWLDSPVEEVRRIIIEAIAQAYESNQRQIDAKARSLGRATILVAVEAGALVIALAILAL